MKKTACMYASICLMGLSETAVAAEELWLQDFRKADLNDSGGLSKIELDKAKSTQLQPIKANFSAIDADRDGHATIEEYQEFLAKSSDAFAVKFKKADLNDSDGLSRKELEKPFGKEFDSIRKNFDVMDADKDGQVSLIEYQQFEASAPVATTAKTPRDQCHPGCGVVVATDRYKVEGEGGVLGAVGGGVVGGLLGNQIGSGSGKTVATVAGAAGGAYVGHQAEKKYKTKKMVKVTVKFDNGQQQNYDYEADKSPFPVGARVQLKDGQLVQYFGP